VHLSEKKLKKMPFVFPFDAIFETKQKLDFPRLLHIARTWLLAGEWVGCKEQIAGAKGRTGLGGRERGIFFWLRVLQPGCKVFHLNIEF